MNTSQEKKLERVKPILLVDGLNFFTRNFCANPTMSSNGQAVGGVVGFLNDLANKVDIIDPHRVIIVWEGGGSPRRRELFAAYKSKRKPQKLNRYYEGDIPDTIGNRNWQISTLVQIMRSLPIQQSYVTDCEADDVIGYITKYNFGDRPCVIMSSDKDYYQLLSNRVKIWSPTSKSFVNEKDVVERFGCNVVNYITTRCFVGDPADGIPGVEGAGWKTMAKRFPEIATDVKLTIEDIISRAQELKESSKMKLYDNIIESAKLANLNCRLMTLDMEMLSGTQIGKINSAIEMFKPESNKIDYIKSLNKASIFNFDRENVYIQLTAGLKNI
jgi:DNA polymerase-1